MRDTSIINYPANEGTARGYLAQPDGDGPWGAIIVIQEWWGLDKHIMSLAERLAAAGFLALAPDLYHGEVATEPDEARKLAMGLDMPHAVVEMVAAANYLCGRSDVHAIGATGFCMGGSLALALAAATPRVGPVASFYGGRQLPDEQLRQIPGPVLALYGAEDHGIPAEAREHLDRVLTEQNVPHEVIVYPGAGHAFMNDTRAQGYDATAATDGWQQMIRFFKQYLEA